MTKTETYEDWAKALFIKRAGEHEAPSGGGQVAHRLRRARPAPILYIDKSMQDHGLFQAICRVNRLDGEDKDFGLYRGLQGPVQEGGERHRGLYLRTGS